MKSMPTMSTTAGASCRQMGVNHAASSCVSASVPPMKLVPLSNCQGKSRGRGRRRALQVDPEADHDTKADGQLLGGHESAADLGGRDLGIVDRDDHGQATDTHTTKREVS